MPQPFLATPPVPFMTDSVTQCPRSLDQMCVHLLHLSMAPGIPSASALSGPERGQHVCRNFSPRGAIKACLPRGPASATLTRPHPSHQAEYLPCSRPLDCFFGVRPRSHTLQRVSSGHSTHRSFVLTSSGANIMPLHDNEDADTTFGATVAGPRRPRTPPEQPDDLWAALVEPSSRGTKMWMWQELADIPPTLIKEKDPEGLLTLRAKLLASLGPQFLWIIFLSTDE
jgi:hypothetical protein